MQIAKQLKKFCGRQPNAKQKSKLENKVNKKQLRIKNETSIEKQK